MSLDQIDLGMAMGELERGLIVVDAMIRRDGYTQDAQRAMEELLALVRQIKMMAEDHQEERNMKPKPEERTRASNCAHCGRDIVRQRTTWTVEAGWMPRDAEYCSEQCVDAAVAKSLKEVS